MSIGGPLLAVYAFLQNEGLLATVETVAELGSIEYEIKAAEHNRVFEQFFERANRPVPHGRDQETGFYKGSAQEFYENLGFDHISLDIDGRFGARVFDLNHDRVPPDLIGWADLTTNLGTSEHVFNQVNCFRVAHDLTKPGGLMLHLVPLHNMILHGLFQYSPSVFASVAEYNNYAMLGQWISTADPSFWLPSSAGKKTLSHSKVIVTLMRRDGTSDFVVPLQIDTPMQVHEAALGRYNAEMFATHAPARPVYDSGFKVDFATLQSRQIPIEEIASEEPWKTLAEGGPDAPVSKMRIMKAELRQAKKRIQELEASLAKAANGEKAQGVANSPSG